MTTYVIVGWYARNPHDTTTAPIARQLHVEATDAGAASSAGYDALLEAHPHTLGELLNWYTTPLA